MESLKQKFTEICASQLTPREACRKLLSALAAEWEIVQGAIYTITDTGNGELIRFIEGYAYHLPETEELTFELGDGFLGQVAIDGKPIVLDDVPEGYINVISGLGKSSPNYLIIYPIKDANEKVKVLFEFASFKKTPLESAAILDELRSQILQKLSPHE